MYAVRTYWRYYICKMKIKIKPLSVNDAWQGRRFKSPKYTAYEQELLLLLPRIEIKAPSVVFYRFGVSNNASDYDNLIKASQDVLQKKYGFNDSCIVFASQQKVKVKKGEEFFEVLFDKEALLEARKEIDDKIKDFS